jgi:adenylate kinase family enzyme
MLWDAQDPPRRIAVIGISGSGKTTLARRLAKTTSLPLIHMDQLFWRGAWQAVAEADYLAEHARLISQERWIIEGFIDSKMAERLARADIVYYLDYSGLLCAWRILGRWLKHRRVSRPELAPEARERVSPLFLCRVLRRAERPGIEAALQTAQPANVRRMSSPARPASGRRGSGPHR